MPLPTEPGTLEGSVYDTIPNQTTEHAETRTPPDAPDVPAEFDERHKTPFEGLLYLGRLEDRFEWCGHTFRIRTLLTSELIDAALLVKGYADSDGYAKAYQSAMVAACLVTIDDQELPVLPLTNLPGDTMVRSRFDWVTRHLFPPAVDAVYERYLMLELQARQVVEAMGNPAG